MRASGVIRRIQDQIPGSHSWGTLVAGAVFLCLLLAVVAGGASGAQQSERVQERIEQLQEAGKGAYLPVFRVSPRYPHRALQRGIEGHVLLEFTVTKTGSVQDAKVIESFPPGIFDRAAIRAASKFRYEPKVVDGERQDVPGVRNLFMFKLTE